MPPDDSHTPWSSAKSAADPRGVSLDGLDIQLLNLVQEDNQLTANEMSERLPLSPSAITRRLNRLRAAGVFAQEAAVVCDQLIDARVTGVVMIQQTRSSPEVLTALRRQLAHRPQIQMMLAISGGYDVLLVVVERDMAAFLDFTDRVLSVSPYVHRFETSFVTKRAKATLAVPLDARDATR